MHLKFKLKSNTEFWFLVLHVGTLKLPLCPKKEKLNRKKKINTSWVCKTEKDTRQTTASKTGETDNRADSWVINAMETSAGVGKAEL